jgi:hypothetical protein
MHRALALQEMAHAVPQLPAAAAEATAAADNRAASNSSGFEAVTDRGTRHSSAPGKEGFHKLFRKNIDTRICNSPVEE